MAKHCIWCGTKFSLITGKPYCHDCSKLCRIECKRCHRPFPNKKYFTMNPERCNSCQRKYNKEKLKTSKRELVEYFLLSNTAKSPKRATSLSVGYDIYASESCHIPPGKCSKISTGLSIKFPSETYGRIADRSGLAWNLGLHVLGGVIDPDYRGGINVLLLNFSKTSVYISKGMRIAQIILEKAVVNCEYIQSLSPFETTDRNGAGLGSTGTGEIPPKSETDDFLPNLEEIIPDQSLDAGFDIDLGCDN